MGPCPDGETTTRRPITAASSLAGDPPIFAGLQVTFRFLKRMYIYVYILDYKYLLVIFEFLIL